MKSFKLLTLLFFTLFVCNIVSLFGQEPQVAGINPNAGIPGTSVTITGSNLSSITSVNFGSISIPVIPSSNNEIIVQVPIATPQVVPISLSSGDVVLLTDLRFVIQGIWTVMTTNVGSSSASSFPATNPPPADSTTISDPTSSLNDPLRIALHPDGTTAYIGNSCPSCNTVVVVDIATNSVINIVSFQATSAGAFQFIAINSSGTLAYVASGADGQIYVLDISGTNKQNPQVVSNFASSIPPSADSSPTGLAISYDDNILYVLNNGPSPSLVAFNLASNPLSPPPIIPPSPIALSAGGLYYDIALTPGSSPVQKLYIDSLLANTIIRYDLNEPFLGNPLTISPGQVYGMAINPAGTRLYVAGGAQGVVHVIDINSDTLVFDITVSGASFLTDPVVTPDNSTLFVADTNSRVYEIPIPADGSAPIDPFSFTNVGFVPLSIAMTPDQAPLASFAVAPESAGSPAFFDASQSASPVGTIASYCWDFGDGSPIVCVDAPTISHSYAEPGTYFVTLTVVNSAGTSTTPIFPTGQTLSNNGGPVATLTQQVTICPPTPTVTSISPASGPPGTEVTITGTNLTDIQEVLFGTLVGGIVSQNGTTLQVIVPAPLVTEGSVPVILVACNGTIVFGPNFTFTAPVSTLVCPPTDVKGKQRKHRHQITNIITWKAPERKCGAEMPVAYKIYLDPNLTTLLATIPAHYGEKRFEYKDRCVSPGSTTYFIVSVDALGNQSLPVSVTIKPRHKHRHGLPF
jgi:DNA-binding beta-propeller fold protein YncE